MALLLSTRRRIVQSVSLVLLSSNIWVVTAAQRFCLPIMNCEGCALAWLGCPIGMMGRSFAFGAFPVLVFGLVLGIGLLFGRFFCGWVCPLGFLQEILHKIPSRKFALPRALTLLKYGVLAIAVIAVPYFVGSGLENKVPEEKSSASVPESSTSDFSGFRPVSDFEIVEETPPVAEPVQAVEPAYVSSPYFFCNVCPAATLQVVLPTMIVDGDTRLDRMRILRFSVLLIVIIGAIGNRRFFCKVLCPVGALIAVTNKFSWFSLRLKSQSCIRCRKCDKACPMDVRVMASQNGKRAINRDSECIECLSCQESCPANAIVLSRK